MTSPAIPSVSIIVPTYREAENLPHLVPQLADTLRTRGWIWEVIIIDDNSPDATPRVLEDLQRAIPQLRYKIRTDERGLSSAVLAGIAMSRYDHIVVMDADLSHPPESVPALVDKLLKDEADFVIGSRYVPGGATEDWGFHRYLNSAAATVLSKPFIGSTRDPMAGFFALRRTTLEHADPLNPIGYKIGLELIVKCRIAYARIAEVPITFRNRKFGQSKLTVKEQFRYLEHLSRLYDFKFPKGSPRTKFLIAASCGAAALYGTLLAAGAAGLWFPLAMAAGLLAMILVTLVFFVRYVNTQRDFIVMKHPYTEFTLISLAELVTGWFFALSVDAEAPMLFKAAVGIAAVLVVRYALRKVFLHDLRGIRGTPRPNATLRLTFTAQPATPPAAASA